MIDLSLHCPVCGQRADMCFQHGDDWKKRPPTSVHQKTEAQLRAGVNEFTQDDPPPYGPDGEDGHLWAERDAFAAQEALLDSPDVIAGAWPSGGLPHGEHPYDYGYDEPGDE